MIKTVESIPIQFPAPIKFISFILSVSSFSNLARSYYKVNQSFLVDLFFIGFMIKVAGVGRSGPWDTDPVRSTVPSLLIETCLRLVGTLRSRITGEAMTLGAIKRRTGKSTKWSVIDMDPVIGLDVAKGESQVQAFLQRKKIYKQSFKFTHDLPGLHTLHHFYQELEKASDQPPAVILESTVHYPY